MEATDKKKTKPKYNMWQNTWDMVQTAWAAYKPVVPMCIALAVLGAAYAAAEMLITPIILGKIESAAAVGELIAAIAACIGVLLVLRAGRTYVDINTLFGRIETRTAILNRIALKSAATSYSNMLDTRFIEHMNNAYRVVSSNSQATEAIWKTWTDILTNVIGFAVYIILLLELDAWLVLLVAATAAVSYLASKHINEWGYRHRKERMEYNEKLEYINSVAIERSYAKDIRMFGLANWIEELYVKTLGLYRAFAVRQGRVQIWGNVIDIALTFLRNGAAYAYLIWYTLEHGLGAAQFLLYFGAVSGFAQWVTGILDKFGTLHRQSLDISELRDYLEWEEPFDLEGGERIEKRSDMPCEIRLENVRYRYIGAEKDTIRGLDLTIHAGEKLAIVGLNGAGKTTLVKLICGFLDPTEGRVLFTDILTEVAQNIFIPLTVGGGINTLEDFDRVLKCGADKVSVNSGAIRNPELIREAAQKYGNQCVVLSVDVKRVDGKFMVFAKGGRENTGMEALPWIARCVEMGAGEVVVNSIDTDGVKQGFDLELLKEVCALVNVPVIASGGAGCIEDFVTLFREIPDIDAGLAASIFHFGEVEISALKERLAAEGIIVRR